MAQSWPTKFQDIINWPDLRANIGETKIYTSMSTGPKKTRKRYTKEIDTFNVSMDIDRTDWPDFETFYKT